MTSPTPPDQRAMRRQRLLNQAPYFLLAGLALLMLALSWPPVKAGWISAGVMALISAAGLLFHRSRTPELPAPIVDPLAGLSVKEKIARLRKGRIAILGACAGFSGITYLALALMEAGWTASATVLAPLAFVYAFFGLWATVLLPLGFGVVVAALVSWKINRLEALPR